MTEGRRQLEVKRFVCFGPDKLEIKVGERDRVVVTMEEAQTLASMLKEMSK